jgi:hypothetical protein
VTLQQRAEAKSGFNGSARKEIPGLTRRSGITGTRNPLFCRVLSAAINGNTTKRLERGRFT